MKLNLSVDGTGLPSVAKDTSRLRRFLYYEIGLVVKTIFLVLHSVSELGRISNKRLVVAMAERIVRVVGPDGRPGFVVCDDSAEFLPADHGAIKFFNRA